MATMPTYRSEKNIQAGGQLPGINPAIAKAPAKQILDTAGQVLQDWSDAHDVMQATTTKANYAELSAQIDMAEAADTGVVLNEDGTTSFVNNSEKYIEMRREAAESAMEGIDNKRVASLIGSEVGLDVNISNIKTKGEFFTKELAFNKVQVPKALDGYQKVIVDPNSTEEQVNIAKAQQEGFLNTQVAKNVISAEEAVQFLNDAEVNAVRFEIADDMATSESDEDSILHELKKPEGRFSYLDQEDRLKLIKESQERIYKNGQGLQRAYKAESKASMEGLYEREIQGTLTSADIDAGLEVPESEGGLPRSAAKSLRKALKMTVMERVSGIAEDNTKADDFIVDMQNYVNSPEDQFKISEWVANAYETGGINAEESAFLEDMQAQVTGIKNASERKTFMENKWIPFKNAVTAVEDFFLGKKQIVSQTDHAMALSAMIHSVQQGVDPIQARKKVIRDYILKENPGIQNYPEEGQYTMDQWGNIKQGFPDGSFK